MTYSNTWSTTRPLGSAQANTADDEIRAVRLDVQERMNDLVKDWSADPVVPDQSKYGAKEGKKLIVHGSAFIVEQHDDLDYADNGAALDSGAQPARAWLPLPPGVVITQIEWLVTLTDGTPTSLDLLSLAFESGLNVATEDAVSTSLIGTNIATNGVVSVSVVDDRAYFLKADRGGGSTFTVHAVRITYNAPDGRNTI